MNHFLTNLKSGVVVFLVALPLCLGIALACNVPLFSGLLAGIIGGMVVTLFSGSVLSVSGPAAGLTSVVLASVASLGSLEVFVAAVAVAGLMQVALGIAKAGGVGNYIPSAVIKGMLAGIGIILIMKQIPHLVGYDVDPEGDLDFERSGGRNTLSDLYEMVDNISPGPVIAGGLSIMILLIAETAYFKKSKVFSFLPAPLLVVVAGAIINVLLSANPAVSIASAHVVQLPLIESLQDLFSTMVRPDFSAINTGKFWTVALALAVVASLESLLSLEATDKLDPHKRDSDSNKELIAQGVGNITSGMIGGLPITAVIVRSSANIQAGATAKLSSFIHGSLLLVTILTIPHLLMLIPNASLAAILVFTGYKLTRIELFTQLYKRGYSQFIPFVVTIAVMLTTDLLKGVGAGLVVSVYFIIRANVRSSVDTEVKVIDGRTVHHIMLPQHITFFNKGFFIRYLNSVKPGSKLVIDGSINKSTDNDVRDILMDYLVTASENKIGVKFVNYTL
jgi:MFS superfamily sulfate permease-like transporter